MCRSTCTYACRELSANIFQCGGFTSLTITYMYTYCINISCGCDNQFITHTWCCYISHCGQQGCDVLQLLYLVSQPACLINTGHISCIQALQSQCYEFTDSLHTTIYFLELITCIQCRFITVYKQIRIIPLYIYIYTYTCRYLSFSYMYIYFLLFNLTIHTSMVIDKLVNWICKFILLYPMWKLVFSLLTCVHVHTE